MGVAAWARPERDSDMSLGKAHSLWLGAERENAVNTLIQQHIDPSPIDAARAAVWVPFYSWASRAPGWSKKERSRLAWRSRLGGPPRRAPQGTGLLGPTAPSR